MPADLVEWIRQQAIRADVSMAQAAASILAYCRDAGLTLQPRRVPVVAAIAVPDHSRADLASTRASDPLARGSVS